MFDGLKRLMGKKQPRRYQVPEGLTDNVAELIGWAEGGGFTAARAKVDLWRFVEQRCPEVKEGEWGIRRIGARFYVEELPA